MLLLHGFGASSYSWKQIVPELAKTNRVLLVDLKGHGDSPKPSDNAYSLQEQAFLVAEFIQRHDLNNLTLVGHSMGGGVALLVALKLADQTPRRIASLVLIDSIAYSQSLPAFIRVLQAPLLGPLITALTPAAFQVRIVLKQAYFNDNKITDETVAAYSAPLRKPGARHALVETAKQIVPGDIDEISSRYPTLRMPTLIIWGLHDEVVPIAIGKRLNQDIPDSRLAIIEDSGHIPQEETPDEVLPELSRFLKSNAIKAAAH
jgi:pimeloyl-ACP methyl ester carboxylesterase